MTIISFALKLLFFPFTFTIGIIQPLWQRFFSYGAAWFPQLYGTTPRRNLATDPASVADRWVRQLEEETGAYRAGRADISSAVATGAEAGPGPSTLSKRSEALRAATGKPLPDFHIGSYDSVLERAQKEFRPLCVIILSDEHDDTPDFKRTTLVDSEFNKVLKDNNFLVWGGDVSSYEGYQTSQKLTATTYPFVAFIALQPRSSRNVGSSPTLTVLSRHQGPAVGTSAPTSARALCEHLTENLLPRVKPYLDRLQSAERERAKQRTLIEEQNAAYELSALRDRQRIEAKIAAEREARAAQEAAERAAREEEERRRAEEERKKRLEAARMQYYRYARRTLPAEPSASSGETYRIALRFPDGRRVIRSFSSGDSVTTLYQFAATHLIPPDLSRETDPLEPPAEFGKTEAGLSEDIWSFGLALQYPRKEVKWAPGTPLSEIDGLKGMAQLVVELKRETPSRRSGESSRRQSSEAGAVEDSDEYDTEEE